tara:strand:+ start:110 stop:541 length:432 start_codon:yes stop_codon:yes gene_type:complete
MKKNTLFAIITTTIIIGCSEKEILPCNINMDKGIAYTNGKIFNGSCNYYVEDVLWKTLTYKRGQLSKEIAYYIDGDGGEIEYVGYRNKDGHIDGEFERYFRNGQLEVKGQLENGYRVGDWKIYNEQGDLTEEVSYDSKGNPVK